MNVLLQLVNGVRGGRASNDRLREGCKNGVIAEQLGIGRIKVGEEATDVDYSGAAIYAKRRAVDLDLPCMTGGTCHRQAL